MLSRDKRSHCPSSHFHYVSYPHQKNSMWHCHWEMEPLAFISFISIYQLVSSWTVSLCHLWSPIISEFIQLWKLIFFFDVHLNDVCVFTHHSMIWSKVLILELVLSFHHGIWGWNSRHQVWALKNFYSQPFCEVFVLPSNYTWIIDSEIKATKCVLLIGIFPCFCITSTN